MQNRSQVKYKHVFFLKKVTFFYEFAVLVCFIGKFKLKKLGQGGTFSANVDTSNPNPVN